MAEAEAQRQHAERTQAVFAETGFAEGVRVQVDGAGFGTVIGVTTGLQIRVRVGRHMRDFPRDQLRVVASDDAAPASPATPPSDELAALAPAPTPEDALDAAVAPAPVAPPCADPVDKLMTLVQSIRLRGGAPPGYESMLAEALRLVCVVDAAGRAGAAPLRQVHPPPAALPSLAADLVAPPAALPRAVETPTEPAPTAMDEEPARTASPEPIDNVAAAASPVADLVAPPAVSFTPAAPPRLAVPATQLPVAPPPVQAVEHVPQACRAAPPRRPRREAAKTASSRLASLEAQPSPPPKPKRRQKRKAPLSVASPEPAAPDASAPAEQPPKRSKRAWTPAEDKKLLEARTRHLGSKKLWAKVAEEVGTRNGTRCRQRWKYQLDPEINKDPWTEEEDAYLLALPQPGGWKKVAKALPGRGGRTDMGVLNRYNALKKRKRPVAPMSL